MGYRLKKIFCALRYIVLRAIVKVRTGSPKTARDELCAPKVIEEVNFPKDLWGCAAEGL